MCHKTNHFFFKSPFQFHWLLRMLSAVYGSGRLVGNGGSWLHRLTSHSAHCREFRHFASDDVVHTLQRFSDAGSSALGSIATAASPSPEEAGDMFVEQLLML